MAPLLTVAAGTNDGSWMLEYAHHAPAVEADGQTPASVGADGFWTASFGGLSLHSNYELIDRKAQFYEEADFKTPEDFEACGGRAGEGGSVILPLPTADFPYPEDGLEEKAPDYDWDASTKVLTILTGIPMTITGIAEADVRVVSCARGTSVSIKDLKIANLGKNLSPFYINKGTCELTVLQSTNTHIDSEGACVFSSNATFDLNGNAANNSYACGIEVGSAISEASVTVRGDGILRINSYGGSGIGTPSVQRVTRTAANPYDRHAADIVVAGSVRLYIIANYGAAIGTGTLDPMIPGGDNNHNAIYSKYCDIHINNISISENAYVYTESIQQANLGVGNNNSWTAEGNNNSIGNIGIIGNATFVARKVNEAGGVVIGTSYSRGNSHKGSVNQILIDTTGVVDLDMTIDPATNSVRAAGKTSGDSGACIGVSGGRSNSGATNFDLSVGAIIIRNGTVIAKKDARGNSATIGSGELKGGPINASVGSIEISGGHVIANGQRGHAAIGAGPATAYESGTNKSRCNNAVGSIVISGGLLELNEGTSFIAGRTPSSPCIIGIGSSFSLVSDEYSRVGNITISGGTIVNKGPYADFIGSNTVLNQAQNANYGTLAPTIPANSYVETINILGGTIIGGKVAGNMGDSNALGTFNMTARNAVNISPMPAAQAAAAAIPWDYTENWLNFGGGTISTTDTAASKINITSGWIKDANIGTATTAEVNISGGILSLGSGKTVRTKTGGKVKVSGGTFTADDTIFNPAPVGADGSTPVYRNKFIAADNLSQPTFASRPLASLAYGLIDGEDPNTNLSGTTTGSYEPIESIQYGTTDVWTDATAAVYPYLPANNSSDAFASVATQTTDGSIVAICGSSTFSRPTYDVPPDDPGHILPEMGSVRWPVLSTPMVFGTLLPEFSFGNMAEQVGEIRAAGASGTMRWAPNPDPTNPATPDTSVVPTVHNQGYNMRLTLEPDDSSMYNHTLRGTMPGYQNLGYKDANGNDVRVIDQLVEVPVTPRPVGIVWTGHGTELKDDGTRDYFAYPATGELHHVDAAIDQATLVPGFPVYVGLLDAASAIASGGYRARVMSLSATEPAGCAFAPTNPGGSVTPYIEGNYTIENAAGRSQVWKVGNALTADVSGYSRTYDGTSSGIAITDISGPADVMGIPTKLADVRIVLNDYAANTGWVDVTSAWDQASNTVVLNSTNFPQFSYKDVFYDAQGNVIPRAVQMEVAHPDAFAFRTEVLVTITPKALSVVWPGNSKFYLSNARGSTSDLTDPSPQNGNYYEVVPSFVGLVSADVSGTDSHGYPAPAPGVISPSYAGTQRAPRYQAGFYTVSVASIGSRLNYVLPTGPGSNLSHGWEITPVITGVEAGIDFPLPGAAPAAVSDFAVDDGGYHMTEIAWQESLNGGATWGGLARPGMFLGSASYRAQMTMEADLVGGKPAAEFRHSGSPAQPSVTITVDGGTLVSSGGLEPQVGTHYYVVSDNTTPDDKEDDVYMTWATYNDFVSANTATLASAEQYGSLVRFANAADAQTLRIWVGIVDNLAGGSAKYSIVEVYDSLTFAVVYQTVSHWLVSVVADDAVDMGMGAGSRKTNYITGEDFDGSGYGFELTWVDGVKDGWAASSGGSGTPVNGKDKIGFADLGDYGLSMALTKDSTLPDGYAAENISATQRYRVATHDGQKLYLDYVYSGADAVLGTHPASGSVFYHDQDSHTWAEAAVLAVDPLTIAAIAVPVASGDAGAVGSVAGAAVPVAGAALPEPLTASTSRLPYGSTLPHTSAAGAASAAADLYSVVRAYGDWYGAPAASAPGAVFGNAASYTQGFRAVVNDAREARFDGLASLSVTGAGLGVVGSDSLIALSRPGASDTSEVALSVSYAPTAPTAEVDFAAEALVAGTGAGGTGGTGGTGGAAGALGNQAAWLPGTVVDPLAALRWPAGPGNATATNERADVASSPFGLAAAGAIKGSTGADQTLYNRQAASYARPADSVTSASLGFAASGESWLVSSAVAVSVPRRPAAPAATAAPATTVGGEGSLEGVSLAMEYKGYGSTAAPADWTAFSSVTGGSASVPQGSYVVRTAATAAAFASEATTELVVGDTGTLSDPVIAIDYTNERVSVAGVAGANGYEARVGASGLWQAVTLTGGSGGLAGYLALSSLGLPEAAAGANATLYVRAADSTNSQHPSPGASLTVPRRPATPTGVGVQGSATATGEGKLTGVSSAMQYMGAGTTALPASWTAMTSASNGSFAVAPGSYVVRTAPTSSSFASAAAAAVTVLSNAGAPAITTQPQGYTGLTNDGCTLSVSAASPDGGTLSYAWYRAAASDTTAGAELITAQTAGGGYSGYSTATLTVPTGAAGDTWYFCVVTNTVADVTGAQSASTDSSIVRVGLTQETFSIALTQAQAFSYEAYYGYAESALTLHSVTVANTGNRPTGELSVAVAGADAAAFVLSATTIPSLAAVSGSAEASFTVRPATGLAAGTYTATLEVSGAHGISETLALSFLVRQADVSYTSPVGTNIPYTQAAPDVPHLGQSQIISVVTYMSSGVQTEVAGLWSWDASASELDAAIAQAGSYTHAAVFTPDDAANFPVLRVSAVPYTCYSPDTQVTMAPVAATVDRFSMLSASVLTGGTVESGGVPVTSDGSFSWAVSDPASYALDHAGSITLPVVWTPDASHYAHDDPPGSGNYVPMSGYLPAYGTATLVVRQTVDKTELATALDAADNATSTYGGATAQAEAATLAAWQAFSGNYPAAEWAAFEAAYQRACAVYLDDDALQSDADDAASALTDALAALEHSHPALDEEDAVFGPDGSPTVTITDYGEAVALRFKGVFATVDGLSLGSDSFALTPGGAGEPPFWIDDPSGSLAGSLIEGSARVALNAAYLDALANGTYPLELSFSDPHARGTGTATVVIARSTGSGGDGANGGDGPYGSGDGSGSDGSGDGSATGLPDTGDNSGLLLAQLLVWLLGAAAICLVSTASLRRDAYDKAAASQ